MSALLQSFTKTPLFLRVVALYAIAGIFIWGGNSLVNSQNSPAIVADAVSHTVVTPSSTMTNASETVISGSPNRITVSRLHIDLPVYNGTYDAKTGTWTLANSAAYYATITDLPSNQRGSTFIYGHNNKTALESLSGLVAGDQVTITTTNNHILTYTYSHDEKVTPDTTKVLFESSDKPRLVIMTCDGIWSSFRRVMYFDFERAS